MPTYIDEPSTTMAKFYPKMDLIKAFMAHLLTICVLLTAIFEISRCDATLTNQQDAYDVDQSNPFHVAWTTRDSSKLDFVFNLNQTIEKNLKLSSQYETNLTSQCSGHRACLFRNGNLSIIYQPDKNLTDDHIFAFKIERSLEQNNCSTSRINVFSHCSTHWNPPVHTFGSQCHHTIEWHSPISCPTEFKNHQRPCYAYNDAGQLVDLTRLIKSDGSSHKVTTGNHTLVKDFHLNICNEASESCGPNVSSCYTGKLGLVESGFNNLTSISYENRTFVITTLGESNKNCTHGRVKTVINLLCSKNSTKNVGPQLTDSNSCENIIDWFTIEACPLPDIQVPATACNIQNTDLGIDINLKQLTNNQTTVEVPRFELNGANYTMMLGLCRGISKNSFKCENKSTSTTSACLIENQLTSPRNPPKSNVTGSITKSFIRLADNRIYLESTVSNKSCQILNSNNITVTRPVGTRIEFYCSSEAVNVTSPKFLAYEDCTYILEWPSSTLCSLLATYPNQFTNSTQVNKIESNQDSAALKPTNSPQNPYKNDSKTVVDEKSKLGSEKHRETFNEAKVIGAYTKKIDESSIPDKDVIETTIPINKPMDKKPSPPPSKSHTGSQPESEPTYKEDRMNNAQKFFMIGLILMSMGAFLVVIFLLDKKTQEGSPVDRMLQPWKYKTTLFVEETIRGKTRRRRNDDGGSIGLIEAEDA